MLILIPVQTDPHHHHPHVQQQNGKHDDDERWSIKWHHLALMQVDNTGLINECLPH